ncbi:MAG: tyrosine-type recombinase/integrase [Christensenellales bacterium]|jgi:integrase
MKTIKNAKGAGTIRKRPDGRWEARFTTGRDPGTGKQIQRSVYGKTQAEARKKLQAACVAIDEGTYTEPSKLTLNSWLDIWLEEYTPNLKPRTKWTYDGYISNHIKPALGAVRLPALNTHEIQMFYNTLHKGKGEKAALSPKTIKNVHGVFHKALKQAVEIGYLKFNPADSCKIPRLIKADIKPLDEKEIAAFLHAIKGKPYEALFIVNLFTGMRQGELLGLTWDCVDFQKGTIFLYRQLQRIKGVYEFAPLKNDKTRCITPAPFVLLVLKEVRRTQAEWKMKAGAMWEEGGFVFSNKIGGHLTHGTVYKTFKRIMKKLGLPETRLHDLRHTYATAALQAGDDAKTVQETLGHFSVSFTLDTYGHVTERMKAESANRMERFIQGISKL